MQGLTQGSVYCLLIIKMLIIKYFNYRNVRKGPSSAFGAIGEREDEKFWETGDRESGKSEIGRSEECLFSDPG